MTAAPEATFSELEAHPALARALEERGYRSPMPVQAAVLGAPDRDLLVSSQTGSGKTVAFGLVLARQLLGEGERFEGPVQPRALVVAPTRELAAQVQRELAWLFQHTGGQIAAFTGGTDIRGDARVLRSGVHVAVGTPGRLVDLIQRKSLDLGGVKAVVLDEADEMLDLGFREELETVLGAVPTERRTLLFSATLPPAIRTLARRFQNDAFALDARQGTAMAHEDIQHKAHLCADGEALRALVNVLHLADEERAIVFCRTRENVGGLQVELARRGFAVTAIAGDRAQEERSRALEELRRGHVRVLVATNVAARGIDLPDVGLVIHADLPENADALTHRSGRTGRAGNKGVNLFIVEQGARRAAERLFQGARLRLTWTAAPDGSAVGERVRARLSRELIESMGQPAEEGTLATAEQLLADHDALPLVAALLQRSLGALPQGETLTPIDLAERAAPKGRRPAPTGGMALFEINLGAKDRAEANWILPLLCRRGDLGRKDIGAIRIAPDRTYFEVSARAAAAFEERAAERDPRAPHVRIERATGPLPPRSEAPGARVHPARRPPPSRGDAAGRYGAKAAPYGAKAAPYGAKAAPHAAKAAPHAAKAAPYGAKAAPYGAKAAPHGAKPGPRSSYPKGPHAPKAGPKRFPKGSPR